MRLSTQHFTSTPKATNSCVRRRESFRASNAEVGHSTGPFARGLLSNKAASGRGWGWGVGHSQSGRGNSNQKRGAGNTRGRGRGSFARRNDRYVQSGFVTKCATKKNAITLSDSVSLQDTYGLIDGLIAIIKQLGLANITTNLTGGRLTQFLSNWCLITQDSWVLQMIKAQWANGGGGLQSATSQHGGHQNRRTRQRLVKWFIIVTHSQKCTHRLIWVGRTVWQKFAIYEALIVSHEHFVFSAGGGGLTAVR